MQRKGFAPLIIIGIIAVILIVGVAGYFVWKSSAGSNSTNPPTPPCCKTTVIPTSTPAQATTTATNIPTSTWQTYTNQQYGFSIQYPTHWYVINGIGTDESIYFSNTTSSNVGTDFNIAFNKDSNTEKVSPDQFLQEIAAAAGSGEIPPIDSTSTLTFDGYPAYRYTYANGNTTEVVMVILRNTDVIRLEYEEQSSAMTDTDQKMISTFQFIES